MSGSTLFIGNLAPETRARAIGQEFERFGTLIRCEIPLGKNGESKG
jgi:RNA recognition motif-containing protein